MQYQYCVNLLKPADFLFLFIANIMHIFDGWILLQELILHNVADGMFLYHW